MAKVKEWRSGIGYDIHCLGRGRKLFLGGIEIPYPKGLKGYSDADVVLHAICDGLFGAAGLGDIGEHFPPGDPRYKDIKSRELLKKTFEQIKKKGFKVVNVDVIIVAEAPNLKPYKSRMRENISRILRLDPSRVNIKAATNEGIGAIGRGEAIAAYAVVLLKDNIRQ